MKHYGLTSLATIASGGGSYTEDFSELELELGVPLRRWSKSVEDLERFENEGCTKTCRADLDKDIRHEYSVMKSNMDACMSVCNAVGKKRRGSYEAIITKWSKKVGRLKKASSILGVKFSQDTNQLEAGEVDDLIELAICNVGDEIDQKLKPLK